MNGSMRIGIGNALFQKWVDKKEEVITMQIEEMKIKCSTEGFDEAQKKVEALAEAYDEFPAQVTIKDCRDCTINVYPSQTKMVEYGVDKGDEE